MTSNKFVSPITLACLLATSIAQAQQAQPAAEPAPSEPPPAPTSEAAARSTAPTATSAVPAAAPPTDANTTAVPAPAAGPVSVASTTPAGPTTTVSGYVEAAYHRSLTYANAAMPPSGFLVTRAYDGANEFSLHAAHLALRHAMNEHVSMTVELDAGEDAAANNVVAGLPGFVDMQEAYATYSNSGFSLTAGRFVTYEGIEVIEGPANPTITRGLLYTWAEPLTHTGFKAHYATGPLDVGVGLVNGWDKILSDNNDAKTLNFRVGVTPVKQFWAAASGTFGAERNGNDDDKRLSLDLTGAVIPIDELTVFFQGNYGSEPHAGVTGADASWIGFGLQPLLKLNALSLGARFEWFKDTNGARLLSDDTSYLTFAITPGYTLGGGFRLRAEYRFDSASKRIFVTGHGTRVTDDGMGGTTPDPELGKNQSTIALSADYQF